VRPKGETHHQLHLPRQQMLTLPTQAVAVVPAVHAEKADAPPVRGARGAGRGEPKLNTRVPLIIGVLAIAQPFYGAAPACSFILAGEIILPPQPRNFMTRS
jgi:hypothetical protein